MPEASDQSQESLACGKLAGKMRGWRDLTRERERQCFAVAQFLDFPLCLWTPSYLPVELCSTRHLTTISTLRVFLIHSSFPGLAFSALSDLDLLCCLANSLLLASLQSILVVCILGTGHKQTSQQSARI